MVNDAEKQNSTDSWVDGVGDEVVDNAASDEVFADSETPEAPIETPQDEIGVNNEVAELVRERDSYLETSRRLQAEFENYRKQVAKRESDSKTRAAEALVNEVLPTLDACDAAIANGAVDVEPIRSILFGSLEKLGLEKTGESGDRFDPELHDAVSQGGSSDGSGPQITEVMRAGYIWKGRTLRPAMVQVSE